MQLHAVIVAPTSVAEAALQAARDLVPSAPAVTELQKPGVWGRFRARGPVVPPVAAVTLVPEDPDHVFVRVSKFGNVTADDAARLVEALEAAAASWRSPALHASKVVVAREHPYAVTAELEGDLDALRDIFHGVNEVARLQRFFLDRRSFRSELTLGTVTTEGEAAVPESVAGAEAAHEGPRWAPTHVTLLRTSFVNGGTTYAEVARVALPDVAEPLSARTVS